MHASGGEEGWVGMMGVRKRMRNGCKGGAEMRLIPSLSEMSRFENS